MVITFIYRVNLTVINTQVKPPKVWSTVNFKPGQIQLYTQVWINIIPHTLMIWEDLKII